MSTPRYHIADIALVSSKGSEAGGYIIVPLISNNDTQTQVFPIYSPKKIDSANGNLPKVLNEVIRLTKSESGFKKLHDSSVLNKLPKRSKLQSVMSGRRPQVLPCPSFANLTLSSGDHYVTQGEKVVLNSKHSSKVNCFSCFTRIDADFKYCPSCGVLRRSQSSSSNDDPSSITTMDESAKPCMKCSNCSLFFSRHDTKNKSVSCSVKKQDNEETLHEEQPAVKEPLQESQKEKNRLRKEYNALKRQNMCSSISEPIKSNGSYNLDALDDKECPTEQLGPLFECPTCVRTFLPGSLAIHRRSCGHTLNFQRCRLKDESNPALTIVRSRKHLKKERWYP